MRPADTTPLVQKMMDEHYRQMPPSEKVETMRRAWHTARTLQLAGLHKRYPDEDEEQLELRLAEIWLGTELFDRVRAYQASLVDE